MKKRTLFASLVAFIALCSSACTMGANVKSSKTSVSSQESIVPPVSSQKESNTSSSAVPSSTTSSKSSSSSAYSSAFSNSSSRPSSTAYSSSNSSYHTSSSYTSSSSYSSSHSSSSSSSSITQRDNVTLNILAFNDTHGNVKDTQGKGIGISKTSTLIKELRNTYPNVVCISQGDMWQGSVESNYTRGNLVTEWMNQMEFVSMTVGNHEYDWGKEYIIQNQELANFPTLGINVLNRSNHQRVDYLSPSVTFERDGAKVGVIGAIGNCLGSISSSKVKDVYFATGDDLTNLVKQESQRLRNQEHCDFIIYSIHGAGDRDTDDSYDISLSNDHYVDLVLEGHTHQGYKYQDDAGVYHVQNSGYNQSIYQITVNLDFKNGTQNVNAFAYDTSYNSDYSDYAKDGTTEALFTKYYDCYGFAYEPLGTIDSYKNSNVLRDKIADLYLEEGTKKWGNQYNILLGGGYQSCRGSGLSAGEVTYSDLDNLFPFDNEIVLCSVKGSDLRNTQYITGASTYFVSWSEYGTSVKDNLEDNTTYYLVSDTYGSDYAPNHLTVVDTLETGIYARDLLMRFIKNGGWAANPPANEHAGTLEDPKTIAEALDYARNHVGSSADAAGSEGFIFKGKVTRQAASIGTSSGDMNNVYVADEGSSEDMQIYYLQRNEYRSPNWTSIDDLQIGDEIIFWGRPFYYNSRYLEFSSGAYCIKINGVSTY